MQTRLLVPINAMGVLLKSKNPLTSLLADLLGSWREKQRRLSVSSTCCKKSSHSWRGQFLSAVVSPAMKCSLNVTMVHLAALTWWLWGGTRLMSILLDLT